MKKQKLALNLIEQILNKDGFQNEAVRFPWTCVEPAEVRNPPLTTTLHAAQLDICADA